MAKKKSSFLSFDRLKKVINISNVIKPIPETRLRHFIPIGAIRNRYPHGSPFLKPEALPSKKGT
ncbi:hypothetical protein DSCO28_04530 [Desulfosarcina ovata subsp. sediminis]|uniref:Uncharacterized protein n=1 Tax=Desulfosarcina ovata subsp. sediminis TaxID=885957 RepID=A0A5K7ZIV1_9BACT|nr:hypothetical protein DSCO28_04530 [Desulfosarcina ovata subsp. sediminis]